ncbi:MAG: hypothetical protein U0517_04230 [Candidatus Andersenbacteria bacterium]
MIWLLRADNDNTPPERIAEDTPLGEKSTDTREDVFKREHDALINSEAVQKEKASRENLRRFVESEVERIKPRQEQFAAQQAASEARREEARQKAKERAAAARAAADEQRAEREAKVTGFADAKRKRAEGAEAKTGGELKSYAKRSRAVYYIQQVRTEVDRRYDEMEREVDEADGRIKEIERELRKLTERGRESRHDFGEETRRVKRDVRTVEDQQNLTREVTKLRKELMNEGSDIRIEGNRLRAEKARLQATLNRKRTDLKLFKRLADQVKRVYENRNSTLTDPLEELAKLHAELRRYKINLPNLRLAA